MERRRCNHHTLEEPLSTLDCLKSVIDPKESLTNKNRYVVASQDEAVRRLCRGVKGVPLVYVRRSVMIMEPMAESTVSAREGLEKSKFRSGLRGRETGLLGKRKRVDDDGALDTARGQATANGDVNDLSVVKKKKTKGPKGPNPLSVKKSRKASEAVPSAEPAEHQGIEDSATKGEDDVDEKRSYSGDVVEHAEGHTQGSQSKRKRKRKPKSKQIESLAAAINSDNEKTA